MTDAVTGVDSQNRDRLALRGQLLFKPNDQVSIRTIFDYARKNERCCSATYIVKGARVPTVLAFGSVIPANPNSYLALLWQICVCGVVERLFTVRTSSDWRPCEEVEYGLSYRWHAGLRRRPPGSFFSVLLP